MGKSGKDFRWEVRERCLVDFFFFLPDGQSGVATEESQERLRKIHFITVAGSRDRRQGTRWERHQCGQEAEDKSDGQVWARGFLGVSSGKGEQFGMGWFGSKLEGWSRVVGHLAWED